MSGQLNPRMLHKCGLAFASPKAAARPLTGASRRCGERVADRHDVPGLCRDPATRYASIVHPCPLLTADQRSAWCTGRAVQKAPGLGRESSRRRLRRSPPPRQRCHRDFRRLKINHPTPGHACGRVGLAAWVCGHSHDNSHPETSTGDQYRSATGHRRARLEHPYNADSARAVVAISALSIGRRTSRSGSSSSRLALLLVAGRRSALKRRRLAALRVAPGERTGTGQADRRSTGLCLSWRSLKLGRQS